MAPPFHPPAVPSTDPIRRSWKGLRWAMHTRNDEKPSPISDSVSGAACAACGAHRYCYGKARERMVCLDCLTVDPKCVRLPRAGVTGKRSGYTFTKRRPKTGMVELVRAMRVEVKVVGAIAVELRLSEKTVRNYLSQGSRTPQKPPAKPLPERAHIPRKEKGGRAAVPVSGEAS